MHQFILSRYLYFLLLSRAQTRMALEVLVALAVQVDHHSLFLVFQEVPEGPVDQQLILLLGPGQRENFDHCK
ncbi:hypothetical protein ATANTOWER_016537, partial [Ataeniobius toweri]|nr:hypothetical protein [Ataeniobius toweri]